MARPVSSTTTVAALPLRSHAHHTPGGASKASLVLCPEQQQATPVTRCDRCPQYAGGSLHTLSGRAEARVLCAAPTPLVADEAIWRALPRELFTIDRDVTLITAYSLLREHHVGMLPVVDAERRACGVVSARELMRPVYDTRRSFNPDQPVADVMAPLPATLPETASIAQAQQLVTHDKIIAVPIVSPSGATLGVVTALDLVRWSVHGD